MAFKVFYAWQSDRPNNLCRGLIRHALDQAAKELNAELEIEDADRQVEIDQDTQGVPGSPSITETIFRKIRGCNVFVSDLTFIPGGNEDLRRSPNPNVLIEYGYALHARGDDRIIGVFNEAFGSPEDLPFDLRHKKWPIRYQAEDDRSDDAAKKNRRNAREGLTKMLTDAIGTVMRSYAETEEAETARTELPVTAPEPAQLQAETPPKVASAVQSETPLSTITEQYPWDGGLIGIQESSSSSGIGHEVRLVDGPAIFLQVKPRNLGAQLSNVDTMRIVREAVLPLASHRSRGWNSVRNRHGAAAYAFRDDDPLIAYTASMLIRNGELHGIDRYHLQIHRYRDDQDQPFIPTGAIEEILIDGLTNYITVAKNNLNILPPLDVVAGLEGVESYRLAVDPQFFGYEKFPGRIFDGSVCCTMTIDDYECDPFEVLLPLFNEIYDAAGIVRPEKRRVGHSQR